MARMRPVWRRIFEEMNRAAYYGNTYHCRFWRVEEVKIERARARKIARFCYRRMFK